jgi:hypothetical protein
MTNNKDISDKPSFDLKRAKTMVDKRILVGLTYYDHEGKFIEQKQIHGKIISVDELKGFVVELEGSHKGETYSLPPDMKSFRKAEPGEYREHSTGDLIVDPDYMTSWVVTKPPPDIESKEKNRHSG